MAGPTRPDLNFDPHFRLGALVVRALAVAPQRFQSADSPKYLTFSTRQFELPPDRPATFAVDLAVKNIGGIPPQRSD